MPITGCSSEAVTWKVQGQQADLHEIEPVAVLEDRIDRRQQRLHDVVDEVAEATARMTAKAVPSALAGRAGTIVSVKSGSSRGKVAASGPLIIDNGSAMR